MRYAPLSPDSSDARGNNEGRKKTLYSCSRKHVGAGIAHGDDGYGMRLTNCTIKYQRDTHALRYAPLTHTLTARHPAKCARKARQPAHYAPRLLSLLALNTASSSQFTSDDHVRPCSPCSSSGQALAWTVYSQLCASVRRGTSVHVWSRTCASQVPSETCSGSESRPIRYNRHAHAAYALFIESPARHTRRSHDVCVA